MTTTKFQEELLARYQGFRQDAPTFTSQVKRNARMLLVAVAFFLGLAALLWWFDARIAAGAVLGLLASSLVRTFGNYVRTRDIWPLVERITDWSEVDRLSASRAQTESKP